MSDEGDIWRAIKAAKDERRARLGIPCPECKRLQPKRNATILLPGQRCRVEGYRDPRKREDYP